MGISFRTLKDSLLTGLLGDAEQAENGRPAFMLDMLSDWLPYRVFDTSNRLYFNSGSKGFILSVTPLIGADERTCEILLGTSQYQHRIQWSIDSNINSFFGLRYCNL